MGEAGTTAVPDLSGGRYLSVNRSGALLWPLLQAGTSADVLVDRLATAFDLTPEQARADVDAWLAELDAEGLLVREQA